MSITENNAVCFQGRENSILFLSACLIREKSCLMWQEWGRGECVRPDTVKNFQEKGD